MPTVPVNLNVGITTYHIHTQKSTRSPFDIQISTEGQSPSKNPMKFRSSHHRWSIIKGLLKNLSKFTGQHLCQGLFFNQVAGLRPKTCNVIKKGTLVQVFSCEFCEISKNIFIYRAPPVATSITATLSVCNSSTFLSVLLILGSSPWSEIILDTSCVQYPHAMPFLDFFWYFITPENSGFTCCLKLFHIRMLLYLPKNALFNLYSTHQLPS